MMKFDTYAFKAAYTYLLLGVAFFLCLIAASNFVASKAEQSLAELQRSHIKLKTKLNIDNLTQFLDHRLKVLEAQASSPMVISSVMGMELASANLNDKFDEFAIFGQNERIYLTDFTGDLVYTNSDTPFTKPIWLDALLEQQADSAISIITDQQNSHFRLAAAVNYGDATEGALIFDIISTPLTELFSDIRADSSYTIALNAQNSSFQVEQDHTPFELLSSHPLLTGKLTLDFYLSHVYQEQEREDYRNQIGSILGAVLLAVFILLTLVIRSLVLNPLARLAASEKKLKASEERYQLAVEGSNDGIWDWDLTQDLLYLSPKIAEMIDYPHPHNHLMENPLIAISDTIHPDDRHIAKLTFKQHIESDAPYDFEVRMKVRPTGYGYFRFKGKVKRDSNGRPTRIAGSLTDVTLHRQQNLALEQALNEANNANLAKSEFLANMSHEIRTPMNGIVGALQLLQQENMSNKVNKLIDTGVTSAQTLLHIINDILDLSKIESGGIELESVPENINRVFETVVEENTAAAQSKGVSLELKLAETFSPVRLCDPVRIKQVLTNLVSNAIKFTENGKVKVDLSGDDTEIEFIVQDTGIGMTVEQMQKLFNRFEQADKSTTRKFGGTGLGLAISKKLVGQMDGQILVDSEPNQGTRFKVKLPLPLANEPSPAEQPDASPKKVELTGMNVLLAEDNAINQVIFKSMMEPTQANVTVAHDGQQAIDCVGELKPDIVFMDIQMPNVDGITACQVIKKMYPRLPIIALTANVMTEDLKKYAQSGFDGHLGKPLNMVELNDVLHTYANAS